MMLSPTAVVLAVLGLIFLAGCTGELEEQRPGVYRGGAYYGDAIHREDVSR